MSTPREIGQLSVKDGAVTVEWTIKDILSYTKENEFIHSAHFRVPGSEWYLRIDPNGQTKHNSVGWISVFLCRRDNSSHPKTASYSFAVKKKDGTTEKTMECRSCVFDKKENNAWGLAYFLKRAELERRMTELAPSDDFTVVCTMRVKDSVECTSRLMELSQNLEDMFLSERSCDATLEVKDEKFSVHKSILTARSPVFASMFEVDMKEKNTSSVDIVDCHPGAFKDFLIFLYSGESGNSSNDIFELYRIAHKYDVEGLKTDCIQKVMNSLSVENFFEAVILGHQFEETELINKTQKLFNESFSKIISSDKWDSFLNRNVALGNSLLKNMAAENCLKTENCET